MKYSNYIKQSLKNKTIYRIILDQMVSDHCANLEGRVVDLAGGGNASYYEYLPKNIELVRTNYYSGDGIDVVVDLNKKLPFNDYEFDSALFLNAIYIMEDPARTLFEIKRILKPGGKLILVSPFIANEMPQPHDYVRYTYEGLVKIVKNSGYSEIDIIRFGERFSAAAYILHPFLLFGFVRVFVNALVLLLDKVIPKGVKKYHPVPLGYFCIIKK